MKKIIIFLMLIALVFIPTNTVSFALEEEEENPYFVEVTKAQVYHSSGRIYIATQYVFDMDKTYEYDIDGEHIVLNYDNIITMLRNFYNSQLELVYDESFPNELIIINKVYNSRWDMNHDLGITGDEVDEPLEREETFWFTTYINDITSYLANGGREVLEANYKLLAISLFNIQEVDMSMFKFNFCYGTDYKSVTSNATNVITIGDMYYHVFEDINEETFMQLYQKVPNTKNWYGVIIGGSLGVIAVGSIAYLIYRKRRKNG